MGAPKLPTPELQVWMLDDAYFEIQVLNADLVAWDRDRAKHQWPTPDSAPMLWLTYLAWHCLTKTRGLLPPQTLREFEEKVAAVSSKDQEGESAGVDPTNPGAEPE
jgi:hypothetical protein